jgi:hypothetical protein
MAVSRNADTEPIYAMHARWLTEVLGPGESLFTPGVRYEDKLRDQIAGVSPSAKQLMTELHAVHFLMIWTGAISVTTKTNILKAILAWMPAPPDIPDDVVRAMGPGLVNPGTWVMTRRDTQITWLIRFSAAWKELPEPGRQALLDDPWALKEFTVRVEAPSANSARALGLLPGRRKLWGHDAGSWLRDIVALLVISVLCTAATWRSLRSRDPRKRNPAAVNG